VEIQEVQTLEAEQAEHSPGQVIIKPEVGAHNLVMVSNVYPKEQVVQVFSFEQLSQWLGQLAHCPPREMNLTSQLLQEYPFVQVKQFFVQL
jgi:hypothetical protein